MRKTRKPINKKKAIGISSIVVSAIIVLVLFALLVAGPLFMRRIMFTRSGYFDVVNPIVKKNATKNLDNPCENKELQNWLDESAEDKYITRDGLKLHAYELDTETETHDYAFICHGFMKSAKFMGYYADKFYKMGYNVFLPDARAHGESEGNIVGMGWKERHDVVAWIKTIIDNDSEAKIFLYGVSMGGATVMSTLGEDLPDNVKMAIEDCGFSSVWDQYEMKFDMKHAPTWPILDMMSVYTKCWLGYDMKEAAPINQVKKCKIPVLFMHGSKDTTVPFAMLDKVYNAMPEGVVKQKFVAEGMKHARSANDKNYWPTIEKFLQENFK